MRIIFFGTPEFAVPSLDTLRRGGHEVAAVVTQPDRPHGRSRSKLVPPPVKVAALAAGLEVLQPDRPVGDLFAATLRHHRADLGVVAAYGHILKPDILAIPARGMINVHASLLPRWRGAAPIQAAILHGDRVTGVSIMQMEAGLDSGPVYLRRELPIGAEDTADILTLRLAELGAEALLEVVDALEGGNLAPEAQREARRHLRAEDQPGGGDGAVDEERGGGRAAPARVRPLARRLVGGSGRRSEALHAADRGGAGAAGRGARRDRRAGHRLRRWRGAGGRGEGVGRSPDGGGGVAARTAASRSGTGWHEAAPAAPRHHRRRDPGRRRRRDSRGGHRGGGAGRGAARAGTEQHGRLPGEVRHAVHVARAPGGGGGHHQRPARPRARRRRAGRAARRRGSDRG